MGSWSKRKSFWLTFKTEIKISAVFLNEVEFPEISFYHFIQCLNHDLYSVPGLLCPLFLARTYLMFACFVAGKPDTLCPSYKDVQYYNRMECLCFNNGMTEDMLMVWNYILCLSYTYIGIKPSRTSFSHDIPNIESGENHASNLIVHFKLLFSFCDRIFSTQWRWFDKIFEIFQNINCSLVVAWF